MLKKVTVDREQLELCRRREHEIQACRRFDDSYFLGSNVTSRVTKRGARVFPLVVGML